AYSCGESWLAELLPALEKNVRSIAQELKNTPIGLVEPEGTFQVWLDFRKIFKDSNQMFRYITETSGIGLNAGHWFGHEGALFMRMNIATTNEKVVYAIQRIKEAVSTFSE
ncbi:MAG TPA: aminotransferase class I/II-fold pyridoxal phosphate-dependent enzyme, partial [Saprospiraceae bacterium]|nr:aminotransferase class I/II-fold pyridoxal phosphate-dependent enzyme [Saprospiraceae bacterium]